MTQMNKPSTKHIVLKVIGEGVDTQHAIAKRLGISVNSARVYLGRLRWMKMIEQVKGECECCGRPVLRYKRLDQAEPPLLERFFTRNKAEMERAAR